MRRGGTSHTLPGSQDCGIAASGRGLLRVTEREDKFTRSINIAIESDPDMKAASAEAGAGEIFIGFRAFAGNYRGGLWGEEKAAPREE